MTDETADPIDLPATGREIMLRHGRQRAAISSVGATLRAYEVAGWTVVDGPAPGALDDGMHRGKVLAPWPNRIRDGRYSWEGVTHQLPLTEVARRTALHGLIEWDDWRVDSVSPTTVRLSHRLRPRYGYPFALDLELTWSLGEGGLTSTTEVRNPGPAPAPWGLGFHPYLRVTEHADEAHLRIPAARAVPVDDERLLPTGDAHPVEDRLDFRTARALGARSLDTCYADLERDEDQRAVVDLSDPGHDRRVEVWMDASFEWVQVYTADEAPGAARRASIAVEPMTCPPDAFRSGTGVISLAPGTARTHVWGLSADDGSR